MGTNLWKLLKDLKGKRLDDGKGISGKGRLTLACVDAMQKFYGCTIRDNEVMLLRYLKKHGLFLITMREEKSWYSYQRDRATSLQTLDHRNLHLPRL